MSVYGERILPRIVDVACNAKATHPQLDVYYDKGAPRIFGAHSLGVARKP